MDNQKQSLRMLCHPLYEGIPFSLGISSCFVFAENPCCSCLHM
jgi:hypothetical protein